MCRSTILGPQLPQFDADSFDSEALTEKVYESYLWRPFVNLEDFSATEKDGSWRFASVDAYAVRWSKYDAPPKVTYLAPIALLPFIR